MFTFGEFVHRAVLFLSVLPSCEASSQGTCEVPSFPPAGSTDGDAFDPNRQYIIPTMNFTGCGVITDWTIVGAGGGGRGNQDRVIELQLFRPDPTRSTVFTKVTSSTVTTGINQQMMDTHTVIFTSIGFTFSPGDVLGFYYPSTRDFLEVLHTNSFSTHSVLTSLVNSPTDSTVTLAAAVTNVPLMSVAVSCIGTNTEANTETNTDDSGPGATIAAVVVVVLLFIIILTVLIVIMIVAIVLKKKNLKRNLFPSGNNSHPVSRDNGMDGAGDTTVRFQTIQQHQVVTIGNSEPEYNGVVLTKQPPSESLYNMAESTIFADGDLHDRSRTIVSEYEVPLNRSNFPIYHDVEDPEYNEIPPFPVSMPFEGSKFGTLREDEEIYWTPSCDNNEIYLKITKWGYQEIPRASVTLSEKLGEGEFGEVYKAELKVSKERSLDVAVKLVKKGAPAEEMTKLLQEAANLGQFKHNHVVRLMGVVTKGEPVMMLMELLPNGDLKNYLDSIANNPSQLSSPDLPSLLLQFCKQVVDGLACLSRKSFVHRDIAARNILLDEDLNCKISDFGMTKVIEEDNYYTLKKGTKIPVKWTSPEALLYKKYSTRSDVWSYGMLMYEIWSLGHKPFEDKTVQEMMTAFHQNYCLPPPPGCPRVVYEVMVKCWNPSHNDRPSASDISGEFCKADKILLSWKKEDIVSPSAQVLGGPLSDGEELYKDLQFLYQENPEM